MTLFLTGSWQQGLLALVVNIGAPSAAVKGQYLSGVAIQNAMYYLKARGIPMGYKFDYNRYGAICQDIVTDMEWLAADEVIKDQSTNPGKNPHYTPGTAINEILVVVSDLTPEERKTIAGTTTELGACPRINCGT
jgi:hypothetical protein